MTAIMLAAALAAGLSAPATADPATTRAQDQQDYRLLIEYGACVEGRSRQATHDYLLRDSYADAEPLTKAEQKALVIPFCVNEYAASSLRFWGPGLKHALAIAALRRQGVPVLPADLTGVGPLDHGGLEQRIVAALAREAAARTTADDDADGAVGARNGAAGKPRPVTSANLVADLEVARLAECVVRADSAAARVFIAAKPLADEEMEALRGLRSALSSCLTEGTQTRITPWGLKGPVAMAYYRMAHSAGVLRVEAKR